MKMIMCDADNVAEATTEVQRQDGTTAIFLCDHHANEYGPELIARGYILRSLRELVSA